MLAHACGQYDRSIGASWEHKTYYFLFDVDRNGIKELIVVDCTVGTASSQVYTAKSMYGSVGTTFVGNLGGGVHDGYFSSSGTLYGLNTSGGGGSIYRVGLSGGKVTEVTTRTFAWSEVDDIPYPGTAVPEYNAVVDGSMRLGCGPPVHGGRISAPSFAKPQLGAVRGR